MRKSALLGLATFLTPATFAFAQEPAASSLLAAPLIIADGAGAIAPDPRSQLEIGMNREVVLAQMGAPSLELERNVWVYARFRARNLPAAKRNDALVVVFRHDRVSLLRVTTREAIRQTLVRQRIPPPAATLAAH